MKASIEVDCLTASGRVLYRVGAAYAKALVLKVFVQVFGTTRSCLSADLSDLVGSYRTICSARYVGARPYRALYVRQRILK